METRALIDHCLSFAGATVDFPFGDSPLCLKVQGKLFAVFYREESGDKVTLHCLPEEGRFLREVYPGTVLPGYHFPPKVRPHWMTVNLNGALPDTELCGLAAASYRGVVARLPRAKRDALKGQEE